jgi:predicted component of type VI protein secretion system
MSSPASRLIETLALSTILLERLQTIDPRLVPAELVDSLEETCERLHDELQSQHGTFAVSTS